MEAGGALTEPVVEALTVVGPLLVAQGDEIVGAELRRSGLWELPESRLVRSLVRPGHRVVDVGAHIGYFTVLASRSVGPTGTVVAVEPEARNVALLRRNLERNGCGNTRVLPVAAGERDAMMSLEVDEVNRGAHRLVPLGQEPTAVRCVRLDDVLPGPVDVVKIDAQGYDHEVVAGMARLVSGNPLVVFVTELSVTELGWRGIEPAEVLAGYQRQGFALWLLDGRGRPRRASPADVLARFYSSGLFDFTVVLARPQHELASVVDECPLVADEVELVEHPDGLTARDRSRGRLHELNSSAAALLAMCDGLHTRAEIVARAQALFAAAAPSAADLARGLEILAAEGLVD